MDGGQRCKLSQVELESCCAPMRLEVESSLQGFSTSERRAGDHCEGGLGTIGDHLGGKRLATLLRQTCLGTGLCEGRLYKFLSFLYC